MHRGTTRRAALGTLAGSLAAATLATGRRPASAARTHQTAPFVSGGIGLTRAAWEETHGPAAPAVRPHWVLEVRPYEGGTYYVGFGGGSKSATDTAADALVMYLEADWGDGIPYEEAWPRAVALLPPDAESVGSYPAPPTPGGELALNVLSFASPSLATLPYAGPDLTLTPDILVVFHTRVRDLPGAGHQPGTEETVTRASLIAALPRG